MQSIPHSGPDYPLLPLPLHHNFQSLLLVREVLTFLGRCSFLHCHQSKCFSQWDKMVLCCNMLYGRFVTVRTDKGLALVQHKSQLR